MKKSLVIISLVLALVGLGCSQVNAPDADDQGTISLRFSHSTETVDGPAPLAAPGSDDFAKAMAVADYALVKVFRAGIEAKLEASKGEAIPDAPATLNMSISVIVEKGKRVAVELYEGGNMVYFGVDEDVDVAKNENTHVSIVATQFQASGMWHTPTIVGTGASWQLQWGEIADAFWYRIQESPTPTFSVLSWEGTTSNTYLDIDPYEVPGGDFYYRVAGENAYTRSDWGPTHLVHVYGAPQVTGFVESAVEGMRGDQVIVTVQGEDLNYPGSYPSAFGFAQTLLSASRTQMTVRVDIPDGVYSDLVTVTNAFGSDTSDDIVHVQNIAYIMGSSVSGDGITAQWYKKEIDSYGDPLWYSHAVIIPSDFLNLFGDLKMFDVIVVGWDSGTSGSDWAGGNSWARQIVDESGAMVLGLGVGGCALFETLGLDIGLDSAFGANQNTLYVFDDKNPIYLRPNPINVPANNYLALYSGSTYQLAVFADVVNPPAGVSFHGRTGPTSQLFPLIEQVFFNGAGGITTGFLWGFHGDPDNLTVNGADLTENVVVNLFERRVAQSQP